ncbi:hypothetical protein [Algibacter sp. 2305UL17-15]|uniref:hypothetical protein n=1 Tax=Algibacter sp. 2305UL17-15 TaxID=3231268 RepID=UPI00345A87AD
MTIKLLKSFTILEALISLMLMSIIIVITYSIFNLIGKQLSLINEEHTQVLEYNLFNSTMISDIEKSNDFDIMNNELILKKYDETEIKYVFKEDYILRHNAIKIDTFMVQVIGYAFLNNDSDKSLNKVLNLKLSVLNDTINTHYFLNKGNSEVINAKYAYED